MTPPRTAGQIAAAADITRTYPQQRRLPELGDGTETQAMVSAPALSAMLRNARPACVDIRVASVGTPWWTLRLPVADLTAAAETPDALAAQAIDALRTWAAADPRGRSERPEIWIVHLSTDDELRSWLGIPPAA